MAETMETEVSFEMDDDLQATQSRIVELRKKENRTPDEEKEFIELKKHHRARLTEQLETKENARIKEAERAARAEQELEQTRARLREIEEKRSAPEIINGDLETIEINGKKFYTDEVLEKLVLSGKMTQKEAWRLQREAIKEEAIAEYAKRNSQGDMERIRRETWEEVNRDYPHFIDSRHPKHDPNDPLYKEANELWINGYQFNPRGLKLAIEKAKKNLGLDIKRPDLSEDFSTPRGTVASPSSRTAAKTVELTDIEKENAIRFYKVGNRINNKTGKVFTESEAIQKAMEAKKQRLESKRI